MTDPNDEARAKSACPICSPTALEREVLATGALPVGVEALRGFDGANLTILDFWRWALGNLLDNTNRGVLAEWLVGTILGLPMDKPRSGWDRHDLRAPNGLGIEVKACAYLQDWTQKKASTIQFSGLRSRNGGADGPLRESATFHSDYYVFCVQIETDAAKWNALDLAQWRFHLATRAQVEALNQASAGLAAIRKMAPEWTAGELREHGRAMLSLS